jgi:predicted Na+-dependent transporter
MAFLVETVIPAGVVFLTFVVGLEPTPDDFTRVALFPRTALTATLGQLFLSPAIAAITTWSLRPPDHVIAGMVLIAACPGGAMANPYTYLAGANTALAVTFVAVSVLGRSGFLLFGTVFFVVEGLVVVSLALVFRFVKSRGVVLARGEP